MAHAYDSIQLEGRERIDKKGENMMGFLKAFFNELLLHGKMLIGYILIASPWLTDYPTLLSALQDFLAEPTQEKLLKAIAQAILALGAGHRLVKILSSISGGKKLEE